MLAVPTENLIRASQVWSSWATAIRDSLLIIFDTTTPVKNHIVKVSIRYTHSPLPSYIDNTDCSTSTYVSISNGTDYIAARIEAYHSQI